MKKVARPLDLVESVKIALFEAILTGKLQPGEKLQQEMLAEKLGVSRQPISHALRILLDQGILTEFGSKSLTVAEPDPEKLLQIFEVRIELESYAAALAARRSARGQFSAAEKETLKKLHKLIERNQQEGSFNVSQSVLDDIQFHVMIRSLSGNPYIHETLSPHLLHHNRLMYLIQSHADKVIWREHEAILNSIINGDQKTANDLVRAHINGGIAALQRYWENLRETSPISGLDRAQKKAL